MFFSRIVYVKRFSFCFLMGYDVCISYFMIVTPTNQCRSLYLRASYFNQLLLDIPYSHTNENTNNSHSTFFEEMKTEI